MSAQTEYGVFDKKTGELLSDTTFINRKDAERSLEHIYHRAYAAVGVRDEATKKMAKS